MSVDKVSRRQFLALGASAALAACTPGSATKVPKAPPQPAKTGVTESGPVTLTATDVGQCVLSKFRTTHIPPIGSAVTVSTTFSVE